MQWKWEIKGNDAYTRSSIVVTMRLLEVDEARKPFLDSLSFLNLLDGGGKVG
jgi:hypothetical protein